MTIGELMNVFDDHVVIKCVTEHSTMFVVDSRKTGGNIPFDLMDKKVYNMYINASDFYADEPALTVIYEEV